MADKDLVLRLWESDAASSLTNEAAREIERLGKLLTEVAETLAVLDGELAEHGFSTIGTLRATLETVASKVSPASPLTEGKTI